MVSQRFQGDHDTTETVFQKAWALETRVKPERTGALRSLSGSASSCVSAGTGGRVCMCS